MWRAFRCMMTGRVCAVCETRQSLSGSFAFWIREAPWYTKTEAGRHQIPAVDAAQQQSCSCLVSAGPILCFEDRHREWGAERRERESETELDSLLTWCVSAQQGLGIAGLCCERVRCDHVGGEKRQKGGSRSHEVDAPYRKMAAPQAHGAVRDRENTA